MIAQDFLARARATRARAGRARVRAGKDKKFRQILRARAQRARVRATSFSRAREIILYVWIYSLQKNLHIKFDPQYEY